MSANAALAGKVALVTGGNRGIGRGVVERLADSGAAVAIGCSRPSDSAEALRQSVESRGGRALVLAADLADPAAAAGLVSRTVTGLGSIDIVVNNAGITRDGLAVRLGDDDWSSVLAVDLTAAFYICRAAVRPIMRARWGRIINISSIAGVRGNPGQVNYSAAKAGLIGLTKALARELGSRQITVNAVAPGFIDTDMTAVLGDQLRSDVAAIVPLGRLGRVAEVAAAVHFLALPEADYITGHVLHVDGGMGA